MGGYNSGGWNATGRPTTADVPSIDVNRLNKAGALREGFSGSWRWNFDQGLSKVHIKTLVDRVMLSSNGAHDPYAEMVLIIWEAGRFGGQRPFFICPDCGERKLHLYRLVHFACRECHDLPYPSQRERESDRAQRRANKIRSRLGGEPGWHRVPGKPKGMHFRTYVRLIGEILEADAVTDKYAAKRFNL